MSKDQYTVHDDPTMKPKTIDVAFKYKGDIIVNHVTNMDISSYLSSREFIDIYVKQMESLADKHVDSVEYWVNVKADK